MPSKYAATTAHAFLKLRDPVRARYNCFDTRYTGQLAPVLIQAVKDRGNWDYYTTVGEPLQYAVLDMQRRGLLLDRGRLSRYRKEIRDELQETDALVLAADPTGDLTRPTGKSPNGIGSPRRLGRFLFRTLGLRPPKRTDTGLDSTDQETLYRLLRDLRKKDEPHRGVLEALFHRSRLKTIYQRYLNLEPDSDERVRAKVKMYGTKTFRFAYAEPALQQFPPEIRHLLVTESGRRFLSADYAQLEARLLAIFSGDSTSLRVFAEDGDVHTSNAGDLFNLELAKVQPDHRNFSKTFLYGISYGGAAETMKTKLYCPCPKCRDHMPPTLQLGRDAIKQAEIRWFARHPAVRKFQSDLATEVRRRGYYQSPLRARRHIAQPWGRDLERELKNLPMQFGGALLMNRAQIQLHKLGAPIALQMHDSFLLEVPDSEVSYWADTCRAVMEAPVPELDGVSFPVSVEAGPSWGELEEWTQ